MVCIRFVGNIYRIPKVLEGGIRPDLRLVCELVCEVYAEEQSWTEVGIGQVHNRTLLC